MLHHVTVEVEPADAERWGEMLGLIGYERIGTPSELGDRVPWYEREGTQVHLLITEGATTPPLGHGAFVAPDFDATLERLEAAGFEVEEHRRLWGEKRSFVLMPGGGRVELMAAPPEPSV